MFQAGELRQTDTHTLTQTEGRYQVHYLPSLAVDNKKPDLHWPHYTPLFVLGLLTKGGVHILGEICPRSNPDIAHMGFYLLDPLKLIYKTLLMIVGGGEVGIDFGVLYSLDCQCGDLRGEHLISSSRSEKVESGVCFHF